MAAERDGAGSDEAATRSSASGAAGDRAVFGRGDGVCGLCADSAGIGPPPLFRFQDKVFHAVCFGILTGPGVLVLPKRYLWFWLGQHGLPSGFGIEVVQWKYIPTRTGSIEDFAADAVGIAAAVFVARAIRGRCWRVCEKRPGMFRPRFEMLQRTGSG